MNADQLEILCKGLEDAMTGLETMIQFSKTQADRIAELENEVKRLVGAEPITYGRLTFCKNCGQQDPYAQTKPLSDEEIYELWCEADNTELLPEMRLKDGSINYIITTFAKLIEERHGIK